MSVSHMMPAGVIARHGIAPALRHATTVLMIRCQPFNAARGMVADRPEVAAQLADGMVTVTPTADPRVYLASLLVDRAALDALRGALVAMYEADVEYGWTTARVRRGFDLPDIKTAIEAVDQAIARMEGTR